MAALTRTIAQYRGEEYDAAIYLGDGFQLATLRSAVPAEGFEANGEHFDKEVELSECDAVHYLRTVGQYRGLPVALLDELGEQVQIESLAHDAPAASAAGLERIERGVYRSWVLATEVSGRRQEALDLTPAAERDADGFG